MNITKVCARLGVVAMVAFGASACSSIPDWVDPTNWLGGDSPSGVDTQPGESPDLASIPSNAGPSTTDEEQQQVAQSLAADRSRAKYSADALRGGTEPVAAPPPPPSAVAAATPEPAPQQQVASAAPQPGDIDTAANVTSSSVDNSIDTGTAPADASASVAPTPPPAATDLPPAQPAPQTAMASAAPPQSAMPTQAQIDPSDAALGFKPSTAPPLDASIAQFVPPPIVARYNQTATQAGMSRVASAAPVTAPVLKSSKHRGSASAMGGPDTMSGAVVANLEAIQQAPETTTTQASVYANPQGLPPASVVFFPGDGTLVNAEGRARIRAAVDAFKQRGGQGYIRIVGHSSSRTTNMPVEKHLEVIFNKSQDRANAVAKEVIKEGVPANRVLVEAVGDSQPVYYESMPKGEDGNRRAEIFLQS
ncbi:MAG TPA: OmpA family protein [Rhizomicrobium sp.]|nr:OmpA family protein [Rhizomicrobium sp.]